MHILASNLVVWYVMCGVARPVISVHMPENQIGKEKRKSRNVTTSPIWGYETPEPIFMKFGEGGELADMINSARFGTDRLRNFGSVGSKMAISYTLRVPSITLCRALQRQQVTKRKFKNFRKVALHMFMCVSILF